MIQNSYKFESPLGTRHLCQVFEGTRVKMTSVQRFRHIFVVLVATVVFLSTFSITEVNGVLGADPMSLMRIVRELCGSKKDDAFANGFYGCYSLLDEVRFLDYLKEFFLIWRIFAYEEPCSLYKTVFIVLIRVWRRKEQNIPKV